MQYKKTRYKGIYRRGNTYYFNIKIKQEDGTYKSICRSGNNSLALNILKNKMLNNEEIVEREVVTDESKSFSEVCEEYLTDYELSNKHSSVASKKYIVRNHILAYFEGQSIEQVSNIQNIIEWRNMLVTKGLKSSRVNTIMQTMVSITERASLLGYIDNTTFGKIKLKLTKIKDDCSFETNVDFYTEEEFSQYFKTIDDDNYKVLFYTLFYTGLRIGELLGLLIEDYNGTELNVNKQLESTSLKYASLKSKNSYRKVTLTKANRDMLNDYIEKNKLSSKDPLFPASRTTITRYNFYYADKANIKHIRLHDFRHSQCALLIQKYKDANKTIDFLAIAKRLGHTTEETLNTYSHLYPNENTDLMTVLEQ